jgi:hypothetical protein
VQDFVRFDFQVATRFATRGTPVPRCPDGTTGSPCVICRDGNNEWIICS